MNFQLKMAYTVDILGKIDILKSASMIAKYKF